MGDMQNIKMKKKNQNGGRTKKNQVFLYNLLIFLFDKFRL